MLNVRTIARGASTLALAATLLAPALAPPTPALAAEPVVRDHRDPYARVMVVIKRIIVHDDSDWGNGEIAISFEVTSSQGCASPGTDCKTVLLTGGLPEFSASNGTVKTFDRVIPSYGDTMTDAAISSTFGIPLRPGNQYGFSVKGYERDATIDDILGFLNTPITDKDGNPRFGTHTERGFRNDCDVFGGCGPEHAKYTVEYEIRRAPLPDLRPVNIKVYDLPGNPKKLVCAAVQNIETGDAGPFEVTLKIDGVMPPGGKATAGRLASGDAGELCTEMTLPATGQHQLSAVVDEADGAIEYNETNNVYEQAYAAPKQATTSAPEPETTAAKPVSTDGATKPAATDGAAKADMTVSAIKANGRVLDAKADCKDGKYAMAVVVKNAGAEKAGAFAVRLTVDGDKVGEQAVTGLEAGKEREVRFEDVRMKKGERKLAATVEPMNPLADSTTDNNELKITVQCKADG